MAQEPSQSVDQAAAAEKVEDPNATLCVQLQQFMDEWFYRVIASSIGKAWGRKRAVSIMLDVLEMVGMEFAADAKESLAELDSDDDLIKALAAGMPTSLRDRWESVALQLQTVLHEASRIRTAAEEETGVAVSELFDEAGADRAGLSQHVLKASVVYAAKEVSLNRKIHHSWRKNTDARIDRLMVDAEIAEHSQQQLMALEAQLSELRGDTKAKSKGVLLSMAEGQSSALVHSVFSSWIGYVEKVHAELAIRKKFTDQIEMFENRLMDYKMAQMNNVKGVIMRGAMEEQEVLLHMVLKTWLSEVMESKANGDTAEQLAAVQAKMNQFEAGQKEKAGQFMTRMASGNDLSLKNICLESWIKFHQDYAQNKELEEKVKAAEVAFKAHMDSKKDEAKAVLDRMSASTDSGLVGMIFQNWASWLKEEKKQKELEFALEENSQKFKSLNGRQKAGAHGVQNRVNEQINVNIMLRVFNFWLVETKANRIENHYNTKYESKRRQLQGVQNLFKSFAMQLEQNLGQDEDSSSRTERRNKKHGRTGSMSKGADGTVSLPDIHQKAAA